MWQNRDQEKSKDPLLTSPPSETVSQFENSEDGGKLQTYFGRKQRCHPYIRFVRHSKWDSFMFISLRRLIATQSLAGERREGAMHTARSGKSLTAKSVRDAKRKRPVSNLPDFIMDGIKFVDTTIRDGHQSLWAENMTTGMMLPVAEAMDRAGFDAIELISSSHLKKCVRELKEDPWARVKLMSQRITHTPLRLNAGRFSAFDLTPRSMYRLFMERMAANGIREARISEEWNELEGWTWKTQVSRDVGINPVPNIIYSVSPKHTDEYFAQRTRDAASLKVNRLCLKDPGGLLTPERVKTLVPIMFQNANGIEIDLHTHCTTGLGPLCCLEAVKLGIKIVNTALPPLADG